MDGDPQRNPIARSPTVINPRQQTPRLSPQARAVFHAMRAGAGKVNTYMCMGEKVRQYATPDGSLSIEIRS